MSLKTGWKTAVKGLSIQVVIAGCVSWGQFNSSGQIGRPSNGISDRSAEIDATLAAKRVRALNADRHRSLVSDTQKLVLLARELEAEIASNPTGEMTTDELHKLAAIEKLAHNVKAKMVQTFGDTPGLRPPFVSIGEPTVR
jgi:hypothetical protein